MVDQGGIPKDTGPIKPSEPPKMGGPTGEHNGQALEKALHTPVKTLGQLKQLLISQLGEKDGIKLYNTFMKSFAMQILTQVQQSAAQAKKASQQMKTKLQ